MRELTLRPIPAEIDLRMALVTAGLPVDDLADPGRQYFECLDRDGVLIGYSGWRNVDRISFSAPW
jgi:hypothetical protein